MNLLLVAPQQKSDSVQHQLRRGCKSCRADDAERLSGREFVVRVFGNLSIVRKTCFRMQDLAFGQA
jgi:hypothetical protein